MTDEVPLTPAPTTVAPTTVAPASTAPATAESPILTTEPAVTTQTSLGIENPKSAQPFYFDWRYQILLVDGALVVMMLVTLTIRFLTKTMGPTPAEQAAQDPDPSKLKTVDQLNIDIPL